MVSLYTVLLIHTTGAISSISRRSAVGQLARRPFGTGGSILHLPRPFARGSVLIYTHRRLVEGMQ